MIEPLVTRISHGSQPFIAEMKWLYIFILYKKYIFNNFNSNMERFSIDDEMKQKIKEY